mmetsp:Transcript_61691/g.113074  ORF Transcript_61691/g.113074 Transcript_61691/m.113074 type:complete len:275 (+) Transcript_61691:537-1361(+)
MLVPGRVAIAESRASEIGPTVISNCAPNRKFVTSMADIIDGSATTCFTTSSPTDRTGASSDVNKPVPSKLASEGVTPRTALFSMRPPTAKRSMSNSCAFSFTVTSKAGASGPLASSPSSARAALTRNPAAFSTTALLLPTASIVDALATSRREEARVTKLEQRSASTLRLQPPSAAKSAGAWLTAIFMLSRLPSHAKQIILTKEDTDSILYRSTHLPSMLLLYCNPRRWSSIRRPPFVRRSICSSVKTSPSHSAAFVKRYSTLSNSFARAAGNT